jgi:DNA-directed RNA polymerase subunit alpha
VLLSSIEGAAITAVRIEGVEHEFSPIPGVVEDATDIILNLKQIPFKMMGEGVKTVRLNRGSKPAKCAAARSKPTPTWKCSTATAHRHRQRRRQAEHRNAPQDRPRLRQRRQELRRRPGARLHPDRFGAFARAQSELRGGGRAPRPDDRLRQADLEVWTNGAVSPQDAIGYAAKLLKDHMTIFINFEELPEQAEEISERGSTRWAKCSTARWKNWS